MDLVPYMYFEPQEAGSQLCAQHCLNNLLQQHTYSEFDLAEIARRLDEAENATLSPSRRNKKSYNYDDTGYFSISVLERALQVWDLALVRWRGEAMKPFQDKPEEQVAFIMHLSSHWIPLRRFAPTDAPPTANKRWYNLNSFLPGGPEWISPTYLQLVLQQAEQEGYSVFVVRKAGDGGRDGLDFGEGTGWGDGGIGRLPECLADRMAMDLGEPVSRIGATSNDEVPPQMPSRSYSNTAGPSRAPVSTLNPDQPTVDHSESGPTTPMDEAGPSSRRRRHQEGLSGVIDPSDPFLAPPSRGSRQPSRTASGTALASSREEDASSEYNDALSHLDNPAAIPIPGVGVGRGAAQEEDLDLGATDFRYHSRSYDDEDAALQAALKASMADIPSGWEPPTLQTKQPDQKPTKPKALPEVPPVRTDLSSAAQTGKSSQTEQASQSPTSRSKERARSGSNPKSPASAGVRGSKFREVIEEEDDKPAESLSPDEIRRKRLAKFGQ